MVGVEIGGEVNLEGGGVGLWKLEGGGGGNWRGGEFGGVER